MNKWIGPKPLVEEHYHIQDLITAQELRSDDRAYHRSRKEQQDENTRFIASEPGMVLKEFWCEQCKVDFMSETVKQVEDDWNCPGHQIAFYRTKCFKGHWCVRLITDRFLDGYFTKSKRLARDRAKHYQDTLQPFQDGFNLLFGKK